MRKIFCLIMVLVATVAISGCVTVKKTVRERVDQSISGNRGYLQGRAPQGTTTAKSKTREYIDVRVEVPTWEELTGGSSKTEGKTGGYSCEPESTREPAQVYTPAPAKKEEKSKYIK